jgi:porin
VTLRFGLCFSTLAAIWWGAQPHGFAEVPLDAKASGWSSLAAAPRLFDFSPRNTWDEQGVAIDASFVTDLLGNPVGGKSRGFAYIGAVQAALTADLEKLAGWNGGEFVASIAYTSGTDLSDTFVGNELAVAEVVSLPTFVWSQLFVRQEWADGEWLAKLGRFSVGDDFATLDMFQLYTGAINPAPPVLGDNTFFTTPPASAWAALVHAKPGPSMEFKAGIFQATGAVDVVANHGLDMRFGAGDGLLLIGEAVWMPSPSDLAGEYRAGSYWCSQESPRFQGNGGEQTYGFYTVGQQKVWNEPGQSGQGLTAWYALTLSPQDDVAEFPFFAAFGAGWQGAISGRDNDWILLGTWMTTMSRSEAEADRSPDANLATAEWVVECDYRAQITPWLYIMPDIQWVVRPGGTGSIPNALVLGAEIGVVF